MNYKLQKIINKMTFGLSEMGPGFTFRDIWYNFKYGMKNLIRFFKVVWNYRGFDFQYNLDLLKRGLEVYLTYPNMEIDEDRIPKENDIKRVIQLIENLEKSDYIPIAEKELGEMEPYDIEFKKVDMLDDDGENLFEMVDNQSKEGKEHSRKVYKRSEEIEQSEWNELFDLIKKNGQRWWN